MSGIQIQNLEKVWGDFHALNKVSFTVADKSLTVLLGPSGCGKSTLLRMIAGLDESSAGSIHIDGRDVTRVGAAQRGVSMVFQSYALFPHLSVRENILFGLKVRNVRRDDRENRLAEAAKIVGLDQLLDRKPANLSGGQRQRVALARTIVSKQPVCLMDEPLSNLDAKLRAEMRDQIRDLQHQLGLTMVYVTHDQIEAMSMADQIVLLKDGKIEQIGTPHQLYEQPSTTFVARFIGVPPMNLIDLHAHVGTANDAGESLASLLGVPPESVLASIGIRPEHLIVSDQGLPLTVRTVDYLGGETVVRARFAQSSTIDTDTASASQEIFVKLPGRAAVQNGDTLKVTWQAEHLRGFNNAGQAVSIDNNQFEPAA